MTSTMVSPKFEIPREFATQLCHVEVADKRSNEEILHSLTDFVPITSEKNIWAFWDKGLVKLPAWCQQNICDWVRISSGWTLRVLDAVPDSPNYALKFLPKEMLPQSFVNGEMTGPYVGPHSSDLLLGGLLYLFGGTYMDVGCILLRHLDHIAWNKLEDPNSAYRIAVPLAYGQTAANHFVMSRKGDPFIKRWHDLFVHLWQDRKDYKGLCDNPLISFGTDYKFTTFDAAKAARFSWDVAIEPRRFMEYIGQVLAWQRMTMLEDAGDGFSSTDYWQNHVFAFDSLDECYGLESCVGFTGEIGLETLTTRLTADPESEKYKTAYRAIWRMLTSSSMQKVPHSKGMTKSPCLGILLDMPENEGKDMAENTFSELLRYGSVHFKQTREQIRQVDTPRPPQTFKKGLFEPF